MKELSAELIFRRGRQPAGQHKLTEVRYDMNNFNRASKCWFRNFDLVCARPGVIINARRALPYWSTMLAAIITDQKTPYIVQKRLNVVNFGLCFVETTVATIFSSGLAKKISFANQSVNSLNVSGTANEVLASLICRLAICDHLCHCESRT